MIENVPNEQEEQEIPDACFQCNSPDYEPGYAVKLCKTCRKRFSRYPLKKNILLGAIGLGVLFAISLYRFQYHFKAAISYEKGVAYADNREFVSAENEFQSILKQYPENDASKVHLFTAYFYNTKLKEVRELEKELDHNSSLKYRDDLAEEVANVKGMLGKIDQQTPDMVIAWDYLEKKRLPEADSMLRKLVHDNPTDLSAALMLSKCLRLQNKYSEALSLCDHILSYNHQLPAALAEKAIQLQTAK